MSASEAKKAVHKDGLSFIEQLGAMANEPCPYDTLWLVGVNDETRRMIAFPAPCKTLACPACSVRNARRWVARIINGVNEIGGDWQMFTLTAHRYQRGTDKSLANLRDGWTKLYHRRKRSFGKAHYVRVFEFHNDAAKTAGNATLHMHGLWQDCGISKRWLKDTAVSCGMGYQVDIHSVDNAGQVAGYIAKYVVKSIEDGEFAKMPKNIRRFQTSRGFPKLPELESGSGEYSWFPQMEDIDVRWQIHKYENLGYTVVNKTHIEERINQNAARNHSTN